MDKSPRRLGNKEANAEPVTTDLNETEEEISKLTEDETKHQEEKAEIKSEIEKSNVRTGSPLGKPKEIPSAAISPTTAKSKIPAMKRQPNTSLSLKNKTNPKANMNTTSSTPRTTHSRLSLSCKTNTTTKRNTAQSSTSRASLAEMATNKNQLKLSEKDRLARSLETNAAQKRTASNLSHRSTISTPKKVEPETNLRKITSNAGDYNKLDMLEKKLLDTQTDFLTKFENMKANNNGNLKGKLRNEYKFVSLIQNDACKLLIKEDQLKKMPGKLPANSVGDFKEKLQNRLIECFTAVKTKAENSPDGTELPADELQELEDSSVKVVFELIDDLCASYKEDTIETPRAMKMQKEIQELKKSLKMAEAKHIEEKTKHDEQMAKVESDLKIKASEELTRKEAQIKDLHKKIKTLEKQNEELKSTIQSSERKDCVEKTNLQEELKTCRDSLNTLHKKLSTSEQLLSNERKELKLKIENIKKLESDLEDLNKKYKSDCKSSEYLRQINELRNTVNSLENDKSVMTKNIESLNLELLDTNQLRTKQQEAEQQIQCLQQQLNESEKMRADKPECSKDAQNELAKLRQSETEKRREIEKLKMELSKALFNINHLEDQIRRDEQLLEVRSELITSLQENDKNQRIQMEELFAQVGEKNYAVNELNTELRNKSGEFRDLYSAISVKQMELSKQKHQIKLLEESNERSQMLRVQQEEKISRMEEDIAHLKQTIALYQANVLGTTTKLIYNPVLPRRHEDYNENFYYYTSERKRKRQVDINVRKYEA